jgi:hypothetical protein
MVLRRRTLLPLLMPTLPLAARAAEGEEVLVVVGTASTVQQLSRSQALGLFTGRIRALPSGEPLQALDLPPGHPARDRFYRLLTGLGPAQMNSYWARLSFSGQMQPPQVMDSEAALVRRLREQPQCVGYLAQIPADERLRVLLTLRPADA